MPRIAASAKRHSPRASGHHHHHLNLHRVTGNGLVAADSSSALRPHLCSTSTSSLWPSPLPSLPPSPSPDPVSTSANGHTTGFSPFPAATAMKNLPTTAAATVRNRYPDAVPAAIATTTSTPATAPTMIAPRRGSLGNSSDISSADSFVHAQNNHRHIDVNAMKNVDVHRDPGTLEMTRTVLKILPVQDTLAILILLLHMPPVILSLIYIAFSFLTFVPPVTTSSGMNINFADLLDWNNTTKPSVMAAASLDMILLLFWLFLWPPMQLFVLDLAKLVISVTLGGGPNPTVVAAAAAASSTPSALKRESKGFAVCLGVLVVTHIAKNTKRIWVPSINRAFPFLRLLPDFMHSNADDLVPPTAHRGIEDWIKSALAIHILMQGLVRHVKGWYIRRELNNSTSASASSSLSASSSIVPTTVPGDPESGTTRVYSDSGTDILINDPESAITASDGSLTPSHIKKKRKNNVHVRLQQPLWSALASTKIIMAKEYELSQVALESADSNATGVHDLGNAPFNTQQSQIWISYIGCDEVCFSTSFFSNDSTVLTSTPTTSTSTSTPSSGSSTSTTPTTTTPTKSTASSKRKSAKVQPSGSPGVIDLSKPFYVRINNANWPSTRIVPVRDQDPANPTEDDDPLACPPSPNSSRAIASPSTPTSPLELRWCGDIYGLRPMSKYVCEFVHSQTEQVLYATTITTTPEPSRSTDTKAVASAAQTAQTPLRPDSPATTLKTSIAAADNKLADERSRLKTLRKEWKTKINSLKKDIEGPENPINTTSSGDDRLRQKIRAQETQQAQALKDAAEISERIAALEAVPVDLIERKKTSEALYNAEKKLFDSAQKRYKEHRSGLEKSCKDKEHVGQQLLNKRNKIATRIAKVEAELAHVMDANARGLDEAERRRQARVDWLKEMDHRELKLKEIISNSETRNSVMQDAINKARQMYATNYQASYDMSQSELGPVYNVGGLPPNYESLDSSVPVSGHATSGLIASSGSQAPPPGLFTSNSVGISSTGWNPAAAPHYPTGMWGASASDASSTVASSSVFPSMSSASAITSGSTAAAASAASGGPGVPTWGSKPVSVANSIHMNGGKFRGRSSSMLSDISGFTQSTGPGDADESRAAIGNGDTSGSSTSTEDSTRMSPAGPAA
ncbi:putative ubiquitination network signaling protein acrB [Ceratocystis fimbriata CBS 114723]|uniref:Putative ubiquitination network signaling protein acrB n=1 Tax=Ceratocystis fimbriata CBS 114723 TaxID=1035309 RepID=A0A2C5X1I6_9PEZI|nr:putative ubiquitination network signaling protein acrB [Ceratocystis fimbriata CBS 114723]